MPGKNNRRQRGGVCLKTFNFIRKVVIKKFKIYVYCNILSLLFAIDIYSLYLCTVFLY